MKNFYLIAVIILVVSIANAQVPNKFSYQAALRNADGTTIENQEVDVRISLLVGTIEGTVAYSETHAAETNEQGIVSLSIGDGNVLSGSFNDIPWEESVFIKIDIKIGEAPDYVTLGASQILSVPYALKAGNAIWGESSNGQTVMSNGDAWVPTSQVNMNANTVNVAAQAERDVEQPIFTVTNSNNEVVFAVYESGARFFVSGDDQAKGSKGGFAVGGLTQSKEEVNYFTLQPDSIRFNLVEPVSGKSGKGGFAVGGLTQSKQNTDYFVLHPDSVRFNIVETTGSKTGSKGGFAVGGLTQNKSETNDYLNINYNEARFTVREDAKSGSKGGFAVGGLTQSKQVDDYLTVNSDSTYIYTSLTTTGDVNVAGNLYTGGTVASPPVDYYGHTYQTVQIGNQVWMKENLQTINYQDGSSINTFNDVFDYNLDPANRETYGLLYSATAVQSAMGLCPQYWHVPNQNDWEELFAYLGGEWWGENPDIIAERLMEVDFWDFAPGTISPSNLSGFSARPAGFGTLPVTAGDPTFAELREKAYFWTSGDGIGNPLTGAYIISRVVGSSLVSIPVANLVGTELYSVRCVKDNWK